MAAINNAANIFLTGAQQYQNANSRIFDAISQAADQYDAMQRQKQANLAAAREKELQRQQEAQKAAMEPQAILAKAMQLGPESLTPQERATFEASQQLAAAKMGLDQYNRPISAYQPVALPGSTAPSASPVAQVMLQAPQTHGMLLPPPSAEGTPDKGLFSQAPTPIGQPKIKVSAENRLAGTDPAAMEELKVDLKTQGELAIDSAKAEREKRAAMFGAQKQFKSLVGDFKNITGKVEKAIKQSNRLNTGPMAGTTNVEGAQKATGKGVFGSGYLTGGVDLNNTLKTLEADSAFSALQNMRDNSPTGGALGGIAVRELELLGAAKQSLEQSQSEEQLDANLKEYAKIRRNAVRNVAEAFKQQYGNYPDGFNPDDFAEPVSVPQGAIDKLKADPSLARAFDAKYGKGASKQYLQ